MTRAYKLAVTIWGVMALSGCAVMRNHDKPNTSNPYTPKFSKTTSATNDKKPVDKTTAKYVSSRSKLEKELKAEALEILDAPLPPFKPIALPVNAFEKYVLNDKKIKNLTFADTAYTYRQRQKRMSFGPMTVATTMPYIDVDEILHETEKDGTEYLRYTSYDGNDYLLATQDLKTLRDDYAQGSNAVAPTGTKLYISFQSDANAERMDHRTSRLFGLNPGKAHTLITTGYLQNRSIAMTRSTLRHERAHDETEIVFQKFLMDYCQTYPDDSLGNDGEKIMGMKRYTEGLADSLGFAKDLQEPGALDAKPEDQPAIQRFKVDYQYLKEDMGAFIYIVAPRVPSDITRETVDAYKKNRRLLNDYRSFGDSTAESTHPGHLDRIYYMMIEQKRAKELKEHGKTVLYEQYGDLLPQRPVIAVPKTDAKRALAF